MYEVIRLSSFHAAANDLPRKLGRIENRATAFDIKRGGEGGVAVVGEGYG